MVAKLLGKKTCTPSNFFSRVNKKVISVIIAPELVYTEILVEKSSTHITSWVLIESCTHGLLVHVRTMFHLFGFEKTAAKSRF